MDLGLQSGSRRDELGSVAHQLPQFAGLGWGDPRLGQPTHPQQIGQIGGQGIIFSGGTPWTGIHELWLRQQRFGDIHLQAAFDHSFDAVLSATAARDRLDEQITAVAASPRFADPVNRLGCLRGISALTGLALTVEIDDWSVTGSSIGAYVGLVPSEYSSGNSRVQGSITKAGNTHVRRLLIESAWHHRKSYSTSGPTMRARWDKVEQALRARGHAGNRRLNKRWRSFTNAARTH
jgi:transposase